MSRKTAGGLLGTIIVAGVAAGIAKYLKDYSDASFTDDEEIENVRKDSEQVKSAAKRTYLAIKEKGAVKDAASELAKATGQIVTDAGNVAKTAGKGTVEAAKEIKAKYDEDPKAAKDEIIANIKDMGQDFAEKAAGVADGLKDRFAAKVEEPEEENPGCMSYADAEKSREEADEESAEEDVTEAQDSADDGDSAEGCCCHDGACSPDEKTEEAEEAEEAEAEAPAESESAAETIEITEE